MLINCYSIVINDIVGADASKSTVQLNLNCIHSCMTRLHSDFGMKLYLYTALASAQECMCIPEAHYMNMHVTSTWFVHALHTFVQRYLHVHVCTLYK